MQPGLGIKVLPRETQVQREGHPVPVGVVVGSAGPEGIGDPGPHQPAGLIGGGPWRAEVVGVEVVDTEVVQHRQRGAVQVDVLPQDGAGGVGLGQQFAALAVDEARGGLDGELGLARLDAGVEAHEITHVHAAVIGAVGGAGGGGPPEDLVDEDHHVGRVQRAAAVGVPRQGGGDIGNDLGHPLAQGIVDVGGRGGAVVDDRQQAVVRAVGVGPLPLGGEVAIGVAGRVVALEGADDLLANFHVSAKDYQLSPTLNARSWRCKPYRANFATTSNEYLFRFAE